MAGVCGVKEVGLEFVVAMRVSVGFNYVVDIISNHEQT